MRWLSTAWFWVCVLASMPFGYPTALAIHALTRRTDVHHHSLQRFVNRWCHDYLHCWPGWHVTLRAMDQLPDGPCVIVANHQSIVDVLALMALPKPFRFVSKASLFKVPFIGFMMKLMGHVAIERGKAHSTDAMLKRCGELLEQRESVCIFPEGTYAPVPERLPFKRGAFLLAKKHDVPLVSVLLTGTAELVKGDGPFFGPRADVGIEVMAVTAPGSAPDDEAWAKQTREQYRQWLQGAAATRKTG